MYNSICTLFFIILLYQINNAHIAESCKEDCGRCKVLTDSFSYWLDRTSRGKFEGGDAAWEETKLKSYARSEIRLVEIQESLCSELKKKQDQCYALNEEVEQVLESWWALENSTLIDLYTWLCIDQLKYCCPNQHYGESCEPCLTKNNKICNGRGKCDGEGTRGGSGTCICDTGYKGVNCNECDNNFFMDVVEMCNPCHKSCNGCNSTGPSGCFECTKGWVLDSGVCSDVNECLNPSTCKTNQFCVNEEGSFTCKLCHKTCNSCEGDGYSNCSSCDLDKVLLSGQCITMVQLRQTLFSVILRIFLYLTLILVNFLIFRKSKRLATLVIIAIAMFTYYFEQKYEINTKHIIFNYLNIP